MLSRTGIKSAVEGLRPLAIFAAAILAFLSFARIGLVLWQPPAVFEYDGGAKLTPKPIDPELVATAIAQATWTSSTYEQLRYRLPDTLAPELLRLSALPTSPPPLRP